MKKINFGLKNKPQLFRSSKRIVNMNWNQARRRFPGLSSKGDIDFDGTLNSKDCKPFNPAQDGLFGRALGIITGGRMGQTKEQYKQERQVTKLTMPQSRERIREISKEIRERRSEKLKRLKSSITETKIRTERVIPTITKPLSYFYSGGRVSGKGTKQTGAKKPVGRPRGVYKWKHPVTGQPLTAPTYYRVVRRLRSAARTRAENVQRLQQLQMARRGIPPQVSQQIIQRRIMQQAQMPPTQIPQQVIVQPRALQQQFPRQEMPMQPQFQQQPQFRVVRDIMTGRQRLEQIQPRKMLPREAWVSHQDALGF